MNFNKISTWIIFYLVTQVASTTGAIFSFGDDNVWYSSLNSPSMVPPGWVIGAIWTVLYIFIATSAYRLVFAESHQTKPIALAFWSLQMVINVIWTPVFIGAQNLELAFYYIIAMWISILMTVILAWQVDRWAGLIMVPYLIWVTFAGYLNYNYWQFNL
jgi:translocator protein